MNHTPPPMLPAHSLTDLSGRVALVTGSGRGLGWTMAKRLATLGAQVALHDISHTAPGEFGEFLDLEDSREQCGAKLAVVGDIGSGLDIARMVAEIETTLGPIDILVNCAGGDIAAKGGKPVPNNALGISLEDIRALLDRNLVGTILMCQQVCGGMRERRRGAVVNIVSTAAHVGVTDGVVYSVAKAGIAQYTRCLAADLRDAGVRVNGVSPGPTRTARFSVTRALDPELLNLENPLKRYGLPEEVADTVAFLCSEQSRFLSGQILRVDGGGQTFAA